MSLPKDLFFKRIDLKTAKYFHVAKATGESTWDVPNSKLGCVPLTVTKLLERSESGQNRSIAQERIEFSRTRRQFISSIRKNYEKEEKKKKAVDEAEERQRQDEIWQRACELGVENGNVSLCWQNFGYLSQRLYDFESNYGRPLNSLLMAGNGLTSVKDIPDTFQKIKRLSLPSNKISVLQGSIGCLTSLTYLNLIRNKLEKLPESIGDLVNLQVLELANNFLLTIPETFANLKKIEKLNLECNKIKSLPHSMGNMNCQLINLNSNQLTSLPTALANIPLLKFLHVSDNQLIKLPLNIGEFSSLCILHVSKNFLKEVPLSIGRLVKLESLWLDHNQISAIPPGFEKLRNLNELKLEGNISLISPPIEIISNGTYEVMEWCKEKSSSRKFARFRIIILKLMDLLKQVGESKINGTNNFEEPHESLFEIVKKNGGKCLCNKLPHSQS